MHNVIGLFAAIAFIVPPLFADGPSFDYDPMQGFRELQRERKAAIPAATAKEVSPPKSFKLNCTGTLLVTGHAGEGILSGAREAIMHLTQMGLNPAASARTAKYKVSVIQRSNSAYTSGYVDRYGTFRPSGSRTRPSLELSLYDLSYNPARLIYTLSAYTAELGEDAPQAFMARFAHQVCAEYKPD